MKRCEFKGPLACAKNPVLVLVVQDQLLWNRLQAEQVVAQVIRVSQMIS